MESILLSFIGCLLFFSNSHAQISGCTDPLASNYNPAATINDGSCIYDATSILPVVSYRLGSTLSETSGLIQWDSHLWTHNDSEDINIYSLDTLSGEIIMSLQLKGTVNKDWEEISQDDDFLYIGDFGNNQDGNRTDLKILRISKKSILDHSLIIDTIFFSYSDQLSFTPTGPNNSDFDCEAFIVSSGNIFLFTKQWVSNKTSLYSLSKTPGVRTAELRSTLDVNGLVTGAVYLESKRLIALCGYSSLLEPFIYLLYDFSGSEFFGGNKRKLRISLPSHQVEAITTTDGLKYFATNEYFALSPFINIFQKLHIFDLNSFLERYLRNLQVDIPDTRIRERIVFYPNPTSGLLEIGAPEGFTDKATLEVFDSQGKVWYLKHPVNTGFQEIDLSHLLKGIYFLRIKDQDSYFYYKIVRQ